MNIEEAAKFKELKDLNKLLNRNVDEAQLAYDKAQDANDGLRLELNQTRTVLKGVTLIAEERAKAIRNISASLDKHIENGSQGIKLVVLGIILGTAVSTFICTFNPGLWG